MLEGLPSLDPQDMALTTKEVTNEEVWKVIKYMKSIKALILVGFQLVFFKKYWGIEDTVVNVFRKAFEDGYFDRLDSEGRQPYLDYEL